jgi:DNA-binding response OmpR family regulator
MNTINDLNNSLKTKTRILLVDDEAGPRNMHASMLASEGYDVVQTDNGRDAVSLHTQNPFDLVITEVGMKLKNGFNTLMELNRQAAPPQLIATAKAGWISGELTQRMAMQLGARILLAKPIQPEELHTAVRTALGSQTDQDKRPLRYPGATFF